MDLRHPGLDFAVSSGLLDEDKKQQEEDNQQVGLEILRNPKRDMSDGPDPDIGPKFNMGYEVIVIRRISWILPQPDAPNFKRVITEATKGAIAGFADTDQRHVFLSVIMGLPSGPRQTITHHIFPRNLKLLSDVKENKAGPITLQPR